MRVKDCIVLFSLLITSPLFAQDEDCGKIKDKKIQKLLNQANDNKVDLKTQMQYLRDAIALDADCVPCMFELGKRSYKKSMNEGVPPTSAENLFKKVIQACPAFHTDPYYFLGLIRYNQEDYKGALDYFTRFKNFKIENDFQSSADYGDKLRDVKQILPEIEFYSTFFEKAVVFNPEIVANVSSPADEYLPMLSPDNDLLFFTRKIDRKNLGDISSRIVEEYSMAERNGMNSPFNEGTKLPPPFNIAGDNFGGSTISVDNKEMIICACKKDNPKHKDYNNCDLYSTKYERIMNMNTGKYEFKWSALENLGPGINTNDGWEAQPSLSADGKTLYYAVLRAGSGKTDIWYATRREDGTWGAAKPLLEINTPNNEKAPFMHSDSKTLYFAAQVSETYWGAGGYDIFFVRQNTDGTWTKPQNIGYPINSTEDEHGLIVSTDGYYAYYASNKLKGARGFDIYRFVLPENARPEKVVIVKGQVTGEDDQPIKNATVEVKYTDSDKREIINVDPVDGKYAVVINVSKGVDAIVTVKAEDRTMDSKLIAANSPAPVLKDIDLKAEKIEVGKPYTLSDILFATNSYELNTPSKFVIDQFVEFLKSNPNIKVAIYGHTDDKGDNNENLILSDNRAKAVMDYIISKGISASRISSKGFGENKPKVPNTSDYNRSLNRRTEFVITAK